ncbi:hypothetical protein Tco_1174077 [Tanacetum coccineum]
METIVRSRTESSVRHYLNTEPINLTTRQSSSTNNLTLVEMKEKLLNMMTKQSQCLQDELDLNVYNALLDALTCDERLAKAGKDTWKKDSLKKRSHDDYDHDNHKGEKKKKQKREKKYGLSISKYQTSMYIQDSIEESINRLWRSSVAKYNKDARLGIHHWHEMRILFYKSKLASGSEHEVYHESTTVAIHDADVESKYGYNLMSMMKVKRVDGKTYKFKESYYNELSLNYIEDIYMLKVQGKLHHLPGNIEYDIMNSLLIYIRSLVIRKRV